MIVNDWIFDANFNQAIILIRELLDEHLKQTQQKQDTYVSC